MDGLGRRDSAVGSLQAGVTRIQAVWRGYSLRKKGAHSVLFASAAQQSLLKLKVTRDELAALQAESRPPRLDIDQWNYFNTHAKLLYLISLYAVEGRVGSSGSWVRSMALDVMIYECIVAGALTFDYAPMSVRVSQPGGVSRRVWLNMSQEGRVAIDELRERGLLIALKAMTEDLQPLTCLQVSKKGVSLLKKVPRVVLQAVDDVIYRPSGHPTKKGELLQVVWDPDHGIFNLRGLLSKKVCRVSKCTEPEDVSYCSSPYLPRMLWQDASLKLCSNAKLAQKKLKGARGGSLANAMDEACYLSDVCVMITEWIPFGENQMCSANERLGSVERNKTNMFTRLLDANPTETHFTTADTMTRVRILDYDLVNHVNFEANIFAPTAEGVIQVEHFGVSLRKDGTVMFGLFVDAIAAHGRDHVSLDFLSRLLVDVVNDSSFVVQDILTPYQSMVMDLTYRGDHMSRLKYSLVVARKVSPVMTASAFIDNEAIHNELRQVIGDVMAAKPLDPEEKDLIVIGRNGLLAIGPSSKQHETVLYYYGALCGREMFIRSLFIRTYLLSVSLAKTRDYIMRKAEDPHNVARARAEFATSSKAVVLVQQILEYLEHSIDTLHNPIAGMTPDQPGKARSVSRSGALQQFSVPLISALNLYDSGLPHDIRLRIKDMKKTVDGVMGTLEILRITMRSVKVQASQAIAESIQQNYSRLIDASRADERAAVAGQIMEIIMGGGMALAILDRVWAGEFNLDGEPNYITWFRDVVITIPGSWFVLSLVAQFLFCWWLIRYMHRLEQNTYGAYTGRLTVEQVVPKRGDRLRKFVEKRQQIKGGFQWQDNNNGVSKLCWEDDNIIFGKGRSCMMIMTYDLTRRILYGIAVSFNLKHVRKGTTEKAVYRYVQRMFFDELGLRWVPVKLEPPSWAEKRRRKKKVVNSV